MDTTLLVLLASGVGINFGWQPMPAGTGPDGNGPDGTSRYEYIVQLEPELVATLARGQTIPISGDVPEEVSPIGRIRIVVGRGALPRHTMTTRLKPFAEASRPQRYGKSVNGPSTVPPVESRSIRYGQPPPEGTAAFGNQLRPAGVRPDAQQLFNTPAKLQLPGFTSGEPLGSTAVERTGAPIQKAPLPEHSQRFQQEIDQRISTQPTDQWQSTAQPGRSAWPHDSNGLENSNVRTNNVSRNDHFFNSGTQYPSEMAHHPTSFQQHSAQQPMQLATQQRAIQQQLTQQPPSHGRPNQPDSSDAHLWANSRAPAGQEINRDMLHPVAGAQLDPVGANRNNFEQNESETFSKAAHSHKAKLGASGQELSPGPTTRDEPTGVAPLILSWVLLSGSGAGNFYLFWSYLDVRSKYRGLARGRARNP